MPSGPSAGGTPGALEVAEGAILDARHLDRLLSAEDAEPSFARVPRAGASNRRLYERLSPQQCEWLTAVRQKYGPKVQLIDVSAGGMLIESAEPFARHAKVVFELVCVDSTIVVPSRVLRTVPVAGAGLPTRYRCAISFARPLTLPGLVPTRPAAEPQAAGRTVSEPPRVGTVSVDEVTRPAPAAEGLARVAGAAWQKVVVKYVDGGTLRGYTCNFHTSRAQLHVSDHPTSTKPVPVLLSKLKAIFFVREFDGDPTRADQNWFVGAPLGRKVEVTFTDGEVLRGSTMSYKYDGTGFFVQPANRTSNNLRVFVVLSAVRHVRFLPL